VTGKASRARRVEATKRARADVYASGGQAMGANPFQCARQARIYAKSYQQWRDMFWRMEAVVADMEMVYGR
jgi:hypothetical protein